MDKIYYKSDDVQSILAKAVAKVKFPSADVIDTKGNDNTAMAAIVSGLTDNTLDNIAICHPLKDSHVEGHFTVTQAKGLIPKLKTANQGTNVTGTCQSNATSTEIKLAASGPSDTDDAYRNMIIATAGTTAVDRLITDYTGSTHVCTVSDTTTAITTSETYTVYTTTHLALMGETYDSKNACQFAFEDQFSSADQVPLLLRLLSGYSLFEKYNLTATGVAAGTLSDTGEFTAAKYDGKDYCVAIMTATTGAGQIRKIASNTADTLTLEKNWDVTPTGTVTYQIVGNNGFMALWDQYLTYALKVYLSKNSDENDKILTKMIDRYGELASGKAYSHQDVQLIEEYADKGAIIAESVYQGVLS